MCQNHGKQVDNDEERFTGDLLRDWKARAMKAADDELGKSALDRPLLQLRVVDPVGGANDITMTYQTSSSPPQLIQHPTRSRFYHLEISNAHRAAPARNVQVFLTRIDGKAADGTFKPVWQGDLAPVWWRYQGENAEAGKPRTLGAPAHLDLCYVIRDHLDGQPPTLQLRISFIPVNLAQHMEIRPNKPVILSFEAHSDEMDSDVLRVKVSWNGQWSEDDAEMARNLTFEVV